MQVNATPIITLPINSALEPYRRVLMSAGQLAYAGADDREVGTLKQRVPTSGLGSSDVAPVVTPNAEGTVLMIANGAIAQYGNVYGAASGKVSATVNGNFIGIALEATTADGDQVEVLRLSGGGGSLDLGGNRIVEAHTADDTLTDAESGSVHTTEGASGTVVFAMPPAVVGLEYFFRVGAAQELRVDPDGTETIALPSTGVQGAAGKYLTANADGETLHIMCTKTGQWSVFGYTGTWTAEA